MSWGQFQGNRTHQLHLKEILPVFKLTHISEFSNSLTSAVDSLCSHGFTHTSVWHFIQRMQSPFVTASNLAKSQKAKPKSQPLHGVQGHLSKCPSYKETENDYSSKGQGKIWKEGLYLQERPNQTLRNRSSREWLRRTWCFPGTVFSRERELCIRLSGQRLG